MNKLRLFTENFLVYGLGGVINKIIPLVMVPIITRIMPSADYFGISDLSNTVIQFGSAIAVMGMYDAMYRMFFDEEDEKFKKAVCSTTLFFTLVTSVVVFIAMLISREFIASCFFGDRRYAYVVYISAMATLVGATNSIISAPTRMQNKRKVFLIANSISPLLSYSISIPLLLRGCYVTALPVAAFIARAAMEISFWIMNKKWFSYKLFDVKILKQLLVIALPLLPNFLIYWIFNSCDKVMIANFIGIWATGVYSVGAKIGQASQLIYLAFSGGWQFFALSTMNESNQVKSNSLVFEYLGVFSFVVTCFVCAWSYLIFKILFEPNYLSGYIVAPYLFLAPLLQMLFQIIANQFLVIKKTWPSSFMLMSGAVVNVIFNYYMIPILGIEGAAIATLIGYIVTDVICAITLIKLDLLVISKRFVVTVVIVCSFMVSWRLLYSTRIFMGTLLAIAASIWILYLYRMDIYRVVSNGGFLKLFSKH